MKTIIAPSLLACDFLNIEDEVKTFEPETDLWIHLDIMDGHFVPNLTFGKPIIQQIASITSHPLDAHLMVSNPIFHINSYKDLPLHNVTIHYESFDSNKELIAALDLIKSHFPSAGLSIKPGTHLSSIANEILDRIDLFLVMSVEPGFGGQKFIQDTYQKLNDLQKISPSFQIQIDGGVDDSNAVKLIQHGANNLVAGSYLFKSKPYSNQIAKLRSSI